MRQTLIAQGITVSAAHVAVGKAPARRAGSGSPSTRRRSGGSSASMDRECDNFIAEMLLKAVGAYGGARAPPPRRSPSRARC